MSLRKQLIVGLVATALVSGLSLGMSGIAAARGGGLGGGGHLGGAHFSGGHFAAAHFGGTHSFGAPHSFLGARGFNHHFAGFTGHRFAHFNHFGHHHRFAVLGVGLGFGYGADSCWGWVPTRYGWRWAWVCDPYY